ncbi:MAG: hypothetical protein ING77_05240 [Rhodocyclaceae bacterium]|nr:hypothetical protein [Rhodocyclaceae bacterium]MCE2979961.1 hypothetical protein [Betaproteobacteria bacterium]MCA3075651.1 hypothetical protein [Rhodocyclaceae bacterium]MCA3089455.1 hypothetical protein [Rhodocyclaceae bacterium]MCA3093016.1 hypothetical protein [Rhodocyclaceae bacterium]
MSLQGASPSRAGPRGRFAWANWTTSFAHVSLLGIAIESESRTVAGVCLLVIAAISLLAWAGNYRRWRFIVDTPTSRIDSAAQGYVELAGAARWPGDTPLTSELAGVPCCWYWFKIERQDARDHWTQERDGESFVPFVLDDGSGQCVVHPAEAEVHSHRRKTWIEGDRRFTEVTILPDDRLYAIGAFSTHQPLDGEAAVRAAIAALIVKWKSDPPALLERFDLDRDGTIDMDEWQLARQQARREVEREREGRPLPPPAVHMMRAPQDGRLFMLSNLDPEALGRRYLHWKWLHLCAFLASLGIGCWLLLH